jgi:trehalose 6-phosphate synthase
LTEVTGSDPDATASRRSSPLKDFVVVANRLPVRRVTDGAEQRWLPSPGGLAAALTPLVAGLGCAWVGWSGDGEEADPFLHGDALLVPLGLSADELAGFYDGFSNRTLWPLYHDAIRAPEFHREWWAAYEAVNHRYAAAAAAVAAPGALVWVHDYQLQLVPGMLRALRPDVRIGFFLHIPYPPQELFMRLPWRTELLEGMLGADVVGFQVPVAARNFAVLAHRLTSALGRLPDLRFRGRPVRVGAYPVSIDVRRIEEMAATAEIQSLAKTTREQFGNPRRLLLGVDRLDYTKGIEARLLAYGELLAEGEVAPPDCVLAQVAVPSRDDVPAYHDERARIEHLVGNLNGDYSEMGSPAVHYLHQTQELDQLLALYCAADVMLVTPYRDGMNLVAKEYVACRTAETGSLVLSEFAGAARELTAARLINPHDIDGLKAAILAAIRSGPVDDRRRMRALRRTLSGWTIYEWGRAFLDDLRRAGP